MGCKVLHVFSHIVFRKKYTHCKLWYWMCNSIFQPRLLHLLLHNHRWKMYESNSPSLFCYGSINRADSLALVGIQSMRRTAILLNESIYTTYKQRYCMWLDHHLNALLWLSGIQMRSVELIKQHLQKLPLVADIQNP